MKTIKSGFLALFSSIGAFFVSCGGACGLACAASGCCGSYALFGLIGLSSSSMKFFEKLTPLFLVITIFSLAFAFYKAYKPKAANCCDTENNKSESDCCNKPKKTTFFQSKSFLWAITILVIIMWTYPYISKLTDNNNNNCNTSTDKIENSSFSESSSGSDCCAQPMDCSKE